MSSPSSRSPSASARVADDLQTVRIVGVLSGEQSRCWDQLVESVEQVDVAQLHAWSRVRASAGFSTMYVLVRSDGVILAGAQVLTRRFPLVGSIGYLSYGPIIAASVNDRAAACTAVCAGLRDLMREGRIRLLFVQPPDGADDVSAELLRLGFRRSDAGIAPTASLRVDLTKSVEELRAGLSKRMRTWTSAWPKRGVSVRLGTEADLPLFADLLAQSAQHQGYVPMSIDYLRTQYGALAPTGNAVLFVGEVDGNPVAVDLFTRCSGMLRDRLRGFDRHSEAANLKVPAAIKWHAMLWARTQGLHWLDFGGLAPDVARTLIDGGQLDHSTVSGSDAFKLSFGGEAYFLPPAVELARPRQLLGLYDITRRSERGRSMLDTARRQLRGGRRH